MSKVYRSTCVIHVGGYCPGCLTRYDARFYALDDLIDGETEPGDFERETMERDHEARCRPYQAYRVMESLRFYARLDAERAPGSW